ncbi:hypothetical protein SKP52_12215 [Sphingopyxis fribergensis]|uniref:Uncharacterized protein n=1 Tax=Sphingopyxis fribergensis TaxID=1515612 RepID=A0A0A7PJC9_9SPHN|nr:hypothetical protein [Sphingopyxis fribergensis]AJA09338.1 hypothetical protein SKP52_12215 [Sphingopyxis fribergensis]
MKLPQDYPSGSSDGECDCLPRPETPALTTFVLRYQDAWFGMEKRVAFEAEDVSAALVMMEREPIGAWAELTHDGNVICRRGFEPGGAADYWVVD